MTRDVAVILAAAGKSSRFKDPFSKKVYTLCSGKPVWQHSAQLFTDHPRVGQVILAIAQEDRELVREKFAPTITMFGIDVVTGGAERSDTIQNALQRVRPDMKYVAVHDAARPCLTTIAFNAVLAAAENHQAAVLASPIRGTVKRCNAQNQIEETVSREGLWQAQTPQVFETELLKSAYAQILGSPTDDSQVVEAFGKRVVCVEGSERNIKITTKEDLKIAEAFLKAPTRSRDNPFF